MSLRAELQGKEGRCIGATSRKDWGCGVSPWLLTQKGCKWVTSAACSLALAE